MLIINIPEGPQRNYFAVTNWFGVFIVDFEQILHIVLVTSLLPLNKFHICFWCLIANFEDISRIAYLLLTLNKLTHCSTQISNIVLMP